MPHSVTFSKTERSTRTARGFVTTTTTTTMTTTTTTRMSTLRGGRRAPSQHALLRSRVRSVASTAQPTTAERFLQHMLEEPHLAEFYTNIWGTDTNDANDSNTATTDARKQQRARRSRARRRASGPLVDIAQVAHVITTMTDYRSDYEPLAAMDNSAHAPTNLWSDEDDADTDSVLDSDSDSDAALQYDFPIMSLHTSRSAHHATVRSALPFRISEASDEGSIVDDARAAAAAGLYGLSKALARSSDPLEGDVSDSDSSHSAAQATKAASMNSAATMSVSDHGGATRSTTSLLMISNADVHVVSASAHMPVPPPSTHNGSIVFSTVFSQDHKWNWASKFLLGLHEPMRHALFVMDRFLAQSDSRQQTQRQSSTLASPPSVLGLEKHVREFFAWFKAYFVEYLTCQHKVKTTVLQPLLQLRHATKLEITTTYDEIFDVVAQIERQERQLSRSVTRDPAIWHMRLENLQTAIRRLYLIMHAVLNLEEKTMHPALSATFSERTFHQYVMPRVFRSIKAKRVVVPWILERSKFWGGEGEQQSIQGMLPFSAKFLYRKFWRPYFITNVASAMKNLNEFVDPASSTAAVARPEAPSAGGCNIM